MKVTIATSWQTLGPFQIGTREAPWGADPLEYYGGFHTLTKDTTKAYPSSLAPNGEVTWGSVSATNLTSDDSGVTTRLTVEFQNIDWTALQQVFGWPALQYQAWLRGTVHNECKSLQSISLAIDNISEFWFDDERYFGGDIFAFRRSPLILHLSPGCHLLDMRVVRDVRAMGAMGHPCIPIRIDIDRHDHLLHVIGNTSRNFPDVVVSSEDELHLPSTDASVLVSNTATFDVEIINVLSMLPPFEVTQRHATGMKLLAGQTRPVLFSLNMSKQKYNQQDKLPARFKIYYKVVGLDSMISSTSFDHNFRVRNVHSFQKVTFSRSGIISYCMLRPPQEIAKPRGTALPVLLYLHGAGIEADSDQVVHSLDGISDLPAWALIPQGTSSWGGDDWHEWGIADVKAAILAIESWIKLLAFVCYGVKQESILAIGHSNGGQGVWHMVTHFPDLVQAMAPVSCYNSIQAYVPPHFWRETDPWKRAVVEGVLAGYRHELLLANAKGIPILQQHGSEDENVPVFHSRRLAQLISLATMSSDYHEIAGGHWFDGIMTTKRLKEFYYTQLRRGQGLEKSYGDFEFVVSNPRCTGTKRGISIIDLLIPGQLSKLDARCQSDKAVVILTTNIKALSFSRFWSGFDEITLDGCKLETFKPTEDFPVFFEKSNGVRWKRTLVREPFHLGGLAAILRTDSALAIVNQDERTLNVSLQIARNLLQYFAVDAEIVHSLAEVGSRPTNVINVATGTEMALASSNYEHPITIPASNTVTIKDHSGKLHSYCAMELGLAAIYLRPYRENRLELVVWGSDLESLFVASRLVPTTTGTGQPDFVITDRSMMWKGIEGTLALGFFDSSWVVSVNSFVS